MPPPATISPLPVSATQARYVPAGIMLAQPRHERRGEAPRIQLDTPCR